ncbi:MAG: outer membrane protein assembly factor BamD [Deltaproteobacteria bacterium]|nr:MAG: outer membrane protein assembly factor BamD [Deltaproteobacteria bacterium]
MDLITYQAHIARAKQRPALIALALIFFLMVGGLAGCACLTGKKEIESAEELAEKGMESFEDEDYIDALKAFNTLKERYPYSRYAILAELKVADAHFHRKEYPEAIAAYEDFVELHPKNEAIPYVKYQIGVCYYEQMLSKDRDQTPTRWAILSFERLLKEHGDSAYAMEARKKINDCRKLLAEHELYVGRFYYKSKHYSAALGRFEGVLTDYMDVLPPKTQRELERLIMACRAQLSEHIADEADDNN